jgi:hypothetical protein
MRYQNRTLLRLSGRGSDAEPASESISAPEQKSKSTQAAAVFRRFFNVLGRLDRAFRRDGVHTPDAGKQP